jgi:hypothetical protein
VTLLHDGNGSKAQRHGIGVKARGLLAIWCSFLNVFNGS